MSRLGERLVTLRRTQDWSQAKLAHEAGISQGYLCQLETGKFCNPSALILVRLADALQVSLDHFRPLIEEDNHGR